MVTSRTRRHPAVCFAKAYSKAIAVLPVALAAALSEGLLHGTAQHIVVILLAVLGAPAAVVAAPANETEATGPTD